MARALAEPSSRSIYSLHPGVAMMQDWEVSLPHKTGGTLEAWIRLVQEAGPATEQERREWLETEQRLGTNTAWWIAERAAGNGWVDLDPEAYVQQAERWVEEMFSFDRDG